MFFVRLFLADDLATESRSVRLLLSLPGRCACYNCQVQKAWRSRPYSHGLHPASSREHPMLQLPATPVLLLRDIRATFGACQTCLRSLVVPLRSEVRSTRLRVCQVLSPTSRRFFPARSPLCSRCLPSPIPNLSSSSLTSLVLKLLCFQRVALVVRVLTLQFRGAAMGIVFFFLAVTL